MPESQPAAPWPHAAVSTEDAAVDSLLEGLGPVASLPVAGHAAVYAELHDALLGELNKQPAASSPAPGNHRAG
ncbi:hypothetical protein N2K95_05940 [Arthrobacter zhaoxinii]|uniref:Uncharacterized protein n=1 Tax=Arthrobacter zhaoxinii TaxID=2964616 RepID=A0ABY5YSV5_9MICC|nr:hypothetical protein [Arthrobacter zhaoxinii]UWX98196.1 hypothetical protein N2K95_05940 [Arthrobacter zhaoxinii]